MKVQSIAVSCPQNEANYIEGVVSKEGSYK
jgi:hypothetical protein